LIDYDFFPRDQLKARAIITFFRRIPDFFCGNAEINRLFRLIPHKNNLWR